MVSVRSYTSSVAVLLLLAARSLDYSFEGWSAVDGVCQRVALATEAAVASAGEWLEFWADCGGVYFLGRGASLASAHEGALLWHEASRMPAAALSTAQFRHGPVEVTGASTRAIIFPAPGPAQELDFALASDMERMGARVRLCDGQGVGDPFAPVVEIIPVQAASCALALAQGLDPGDFRYASLVTASETGFRSFR
jgi:glucosamine--fructose-6-phosphate aminotransferase (isomerizing)